LRANIGKSLRERPLTLSFRPYGKIETRASPLFGGIEWVLFHVILVFSDGCDEIRKKGGALQFFRFWPTGTDSAGQTFAHHDCALKLGNHTQAPEVSPVR
jgi:hypothetical protein